MSSYTTQLRFICESLAQNKPMGETGVDAVIAAARPKIFDFAYPYYKESDRSRFESMILEYFYTREIGYETYGLWKLRLKTKLKLIMPYYNQFYESAELAFDPLTDYNEERVGSRKTDNVTDDNNSSSSSTNTDTDNESLSKSLDTPQNGVTDLLSGKYLTQAAQVSGSNSAVSRGSQQSTGKNVFDGKENYQETIKGKRGSSSYAKLLQEYRDSILNVDQLVLNELEDLFLGIW